jgi:hypothetical protein
MAHIAVWAALNKLVVLLQDSYDAPVAIKNSTRPEHDNESDESNNVGDNVDRECVFTRDTQPSGMKFTLPSTLTPNNVTGFGYIKVFGPILIFFII